MRCQSDTEFDSLWNEYFRIPWKPGRRKSKTCAARPGQVPGEQGALKTIGRKSRKLGRKDDGRGKIGGRKTEMLVNYGI